MLLSCFLFQKLFVLSHSSCLLIIQLSVKGLASGACFISIFNANILKAHIKPCHHSFLPKQWISGCNSWNRFYYLSSVLCIINLLLLWQNIASSPSLSSSCYQCYFLILLLFYFIIIVILLLLLLLLSPTSLSLLLPQRFWI